MPFKRIIYSILVFLLSGIPPFSHSSSLTLSLSPSTSSTQDEARFLRDVLSKVSEKDDATNRHLQEAKESNLNLSESLHRATLEFQVPPHHSHHFTSRHFSHSFNLSVLRLVQITILTFFFCNLSSG